MYAFDYHRPNSVAEAARLLAGAPESKLLAGGHTLLPTMKLRLAGPKTIIDLGRVAELRGIERTGNDLVIGAMETHDAVASSPQVKSAVAATIAAMPLRLRRAACAASIWVNAIGRASELPCHLSCTLPPCCRARSPHDLVRPVNQRLKGLEAERPRGF